MALPMSTGKATTMRVHAEDGPDSFRGGKEVSPEAQPTADPRVEVAVCRKGNKRRGRLERGTTETGLLTEICAEYRTPAGTGLLLRCWEVHAGAPEEMDPMLVKHMVYTVEEMEAPAQIWKPNAAQHKRSCRGPCASGVRIQSWPAIVRSPWIVCFSRRGHHLLQQKTVCFSRRGHHLRQRLKRDEERRTSNGRPTLDSR
jgi:hypothetical protein